MVRTRIPPPKVLLEPLGAGLTTLPMISFSVTMISVLDSVLPAVRTNRPPPPLTSPVSAMVVVVFPLVQGCGSASPQPIVLLLIVICVSPASQNALPESGAEYT